MEDALFIGAVLVVFFGTVYVAIVGSKDRERPLAVMALALMLGATVMAGIIEKVPHWKPVMAYPVVGLFLGGVLIAGYLSITLQRKK